MTALIETKFNTNGKLVIVVGDIIKANCDVVGNSIGPKDDVTSTFVPRGVLEAGFAEKGGVELVKELESKKHGRWGFGDIIFTPSHNLNKGDDTDPKDICHFCVPRSFEGEITISVSVV